MAALQAGPLIYHRFSGHIKHNMKPRYWITALAIALAVAVIAVERLASREEIPGNYTVHAGINYSPLDTELKLDIYLPHHGAKPVPCVIVIQGGGFKSQDGQHFRHFARYLAEQGFAAALIGYRGRPEHTFQTTVSDIRAATRYIRAHGEEFAIDTDNIGVMGRSAGATLAALLALSEEDAEHGRQPADADISSRIQAAVAIAGVYDFIARFSADEQTAIQPDLKSKLDTNAEWIGTPFSSTDESWLKASAINHVDSEDPPILLMHSKDDEVVPWMQSADMHQALQIAGAKSELVLSETGGHSGPAKAKELMASFFRKALIKKEKD